MNQQDFFGLTKKLSDERGVVGDEARVAAILAKELEPYVQDISFDRFGNLIAVKKGKKGGPTVILEAHIDEIGLVVDFIDENGFISFKHLGVYEPRILPAQRMLLRTRKKGEIHAVVGMKPLHIELSGPSDNKAWTMGELFLDIGARSAAEAAEAGVRKGDPICFESELIRFEANPNMIVGKALDNRIGCACMVDVMEQLSRQDHDATVYAIATMQAELALNGGYNLDPRTLTADIAIIFDTTVAGDVPGIDPRSAVSKIGAGTLIKVAEYGEWPHGHVVNRKFVDFLISVAEEKGIPYQLEVLEEATTTATAIQHALGGIIAGTISVPTRYLHCPIELADLGDALATSRLAAEVVKKLDARRVELLYAHRDY